MFTKLEAEELGDHKGGDCMSVKHDHESAVSAK
jgi:hypothetical protein